MSDQDLFHELMFYTLAHRDARFIHQHAVDAYAAQHADATSKPIATVFALVGLYLYLEKGFSGRQVQKAHMQLAKRPNQWYRPSRPEARGSVVISEVLAAQPGAGRDVMIHQWCVSVWSAWATGHTRIADLARKELDVR